MTEDSNINSLEEEIVNLVGKYAELRHKNHDFIPEISQIPVNGRVFDKNEVIELVKASLDFWLTDGEYSEKFSEKMS